MNQITQLTPEQEAQIPEYVTKYVGIGLNTERIDPAKAEEFALRLYAFLKREPPTVICTEGINSAWETTVLCAIAQDQNISFKEAKEKHSDEVSKITFVEPFFDGQFCASYVGWFNYMKSIGVKIDAETFVYEDATQFGPIWAMEKYCIFSDRMLECHRNAAGQLHKNGGPAVKYVDGTAVYFLNGVSVPQWLAESDDHSLDPKQFATIQNVEVRREFIRKVGVDRICLELGSKIVDKAEGYELHVIDLGGETGAWPYLKMKNPSIDAWHMECVDKSCTTVAQALEFRNQSTLKPEQLT